MTIFGHGQRSLFCLLFVKQGLLIINFKHVPTRIRSATGGGGGGEVGDGGGFETAGCSF